VVLLRGEGQGDNQNFDPQHDQIQVSLLDGDETTFFHGFLRVAKGRVRCDISEERFQEFHIVVHL
jgi:hypothetical protein